MESEMELKWSKPTAEAAAGFGENDSPYAHFWLDQRGLADPKTGDAVKKRSVVEVAGALNLDLENLVSRAFE